MAVVVASVVQVQVGQAQVGEAHWQKMEMEIVAMLQWQH